jgi:hypothetical protein
MKKHVFQYAIPEPCHEDWTAMTPSEKGRFCASCQKTVIDFSRMTDTEVVKRLSEVTGSICGRMSDNQLERDFVLYERSQFPVDLRAVLFGVALSLSAATPAYTQGEVVLRTETVQQAEDGKFLELSGTITGYAPDGRGETTVTIYSTKGKALSSVLADTQGRFTISCKGKRKPRSVVFHRDGYEPVTYMLAELTDRTGMTVQLHPVTSKPVIGVLLPLYVNGSEQEAGTTTTPDSLLQPAGPTTIRARVTNLKNEPLSDVQVILYDGNADTLAVFITDAEGRIAIDLTKYADPWSLLIRPNEQLYDPKTQRLTALDPAKENTIFVANASPRKQGGIMIQKKEDDSWRQKNIKSKKQ